MLPVGSATANVTSKALALEGVPWEADCSGSIFLEETFIADLDSFLAMGVVSGTRPEVNGSELDFKDVLFTAVEFA